MEIHLPRFLTSESGVIHLRHGAAHNERLDVTCAVVRRSVDSGHIIFVSARSPAHKMWYFVIHEDPNHDPDVIFVYDNTRATEPCSVGFGAVTQIRGHAKIH